MLVPEKENRGLGRQRSQGLLRNSRRRRLYRKNTGSGWKAVGWTETIIQHEGGRDAAYRPSSSATSEGDTPTGGSVPTAKSQAPAPSPSRTTSSEPSGQTEAPGADNGPSSGCSSRPREPGPGCHREGTQLKMAFLPQGMVMRPPTAPRRGLTKEGGVTHSSPVRA